jgi:signal transduction histidine kinase
MAGARPPRKKKTSSGAPDEAREARAPEERRRSEAEELRREAEARVDDMSAATTAASPVPEDIAAIVHELRVHQIELEMQNEELRRAQLELDEQRAKYFELFDLAPVGYLTVSDTGIVTDANLTAAELLRVDRQLLVGQPLSAFVHAPDRDAYYLHTRALWKTGVRQTWELRLRRWGGAAGAEAPGHFWARFEARPQDGADGETPSCWMTFTDVDESVAAQEALRESREALREAHDLAHIGVWEWEAASDRVIWTDELYRIAGLDPRLPAPTYAEHSRVYTPESWRHLQAAVDRALETGEPYRLELELVRPDGATRWVSAVGGAASDDGGGGVRLCGTVQDITESKLAEAEIRRLNAGLEQRVAARTADLEAVNKELEAFVYSAAHDLRAPLRAIDGFSQMVVEDAAERLDAADMEHLQRVRAAAERMGALIDHLIELSRTARVDLVSEQVDVSAVAAAVLADLRRAAPEREVEAFVEPGLMVMADATLLEVILVNLLSNAWKFTSKRATAHIEVGVTDGGGERAFFVRDDGAGFDLSKAQHLFGAFQRFHTPDEFPGDGIGLATVQRLVTKHGGRVWAEAEVGKGATFFFTLPAHESEAAPRRPGMSPGGLG